MDMDIEVALDAELLLQTVPILSLEYCLSKIILDRLVTASSDQP